MPLIIFVDENGDKNGYFGPVLGSLPDTEEGLKLWDGLAAMANSKEFFELKGKRTGGPAVESTKRVFPDLA